MTGRACMWIALLVTFAWLAVWIGNPYDVPVIVWMIIQDVAHKIAWYFYTI